MKRRRRYRQDRVLRRVLLVQHLHTLVVAPHQGFHARDKIGRRHRLRTVLSKDLRPIERQSLEQLVHATVRLLLLGCLVQHLQPLLLLDMLPKVLDAPLPKTRRLHSATMVHVGHEHFNDVIHEAVRVQNEERVRFGCLHLNHDLLNLIDMWHASTWDVTKIAWGRMTTATSSHVLIVVRVVNGAVDNISRLPREARVAYGAPHLVASLRLVNPILALRARLRVLSQDLDGVDGVLVALVGGIIIGAWLEAMLTILLFAHDALVRMIPHCTTPLGMERCTYPRVQASHQQTHPRPCSAYDIIGSGQTPEPVSDRESYS